jgi:hypothetical protein
MKKKYDRPELHVTTIELGVFGNYDKPIDSDPNPDLSVGNHQ